MNNFSPFDASGGLYRYSCVGFGSHDNLQWRFGGQLITNTSPETSEPYYLEMVSAREVRLVVFSARVGQLGAIFECASQAGAIASMKLTVDGNLNTTITGSSYEFMSSLSRPILHASHCGACTIEPRTTIHSSIHICC